MPIDTSTLEGLHFLLPEELLQQLDSYMAGHKRPHSDQLRAVLAQDHAALELLLQDPDTAGEILRQNDVIDGWLRLVDPSPDNRSWGSDIHVIAWITRASGETPQQVPCE